MCEQSSFFCAISQFLTSISPANKKRLVAAVVLVSAFVCAPTTSLLAQTPTAVPVLTWRYDLTHAGQNTSETALTPANVASNAFGKLFSLSVDDHVFAQPLYVPNLTMSDGKAHNVLFIATENDTLYAFDADSAGNPIWKVSLLTSAYGAGAGATPVPEVAKDNGQDIGPNIGITGTPVIDPTTNTMYVVSNTAESGAYYSRLHAINIVTGAEQPGGPANITASVPGSGTGSSGGQRTFSAYQENQRPALGLYNGYVYIAYSSHGDIAPWEGWLFAYNAATLQQTAAICLSPDDDGSSVWGGGAGLPIDTSVSGGRMFVVTGNGGRSTPLQSNSDYGESVIAFNLANGKLTPTDAWTAFNYENMNTQDWDQGSAGVLMLPDQTGTYPHLLITAGKDGRITMLNRDNLGGLAPSGSTSNTNAVQDIALSEIPEGEGFWSTAAYWNGNVYMWAGGDDGGTPNVGMAFKLTNGVLSSTPSSKTTFTSAFPGPTFSVSSNGTQNGIVWALKYDQFNTDGPAVLYAFDPDDISQVFYESDTNASRDSAGPANKFAVPVVTNGKVYVATNRKVDVYGLLNAAPTAAAPVITPDGGSFTSTQSITLSTTTPSASIYYTLDGTTPTTASTLYSGAFTINATATVKAIATASGDAQSAVSSATFTLAGQTPPVTFQPAAGTYTGAQQVTISDSDASAKIYYTTDGSTPSASSTPYAGPIQVAVSETIKAIAMDPAMQNSNIITAAYTINAPGQTSPVTFQPAAGTYTGAQQVTISDSDASAKIYYTAGGSTPSASSTPYAGPIQVAVSETIKAIAMDPAMQNSNIITAAYTINAPGQTPPVTFQPAAGTYTVAQQVTISDSDASAKIYYTAGGSTPSASSTPYAGPILVAASETINAIAIDPAMQSSTIATAAYTINAGSGGGGGGQPPFTVSATAPAAVTPGGTATSTITIAPNGGFTGTVTVGCALTSSPTGAVDPATCSVTQPASIAGSGSVTSTLTISTTAATTSARLRNPLSPLVAFGGGSTLAAMLFICLPARRRRWQAFFGFLLLAVISAVSIGCTANLPSIKSNGGTTAGAYTFTVTGASGSTSATASVTATVQ